VSNGGSFSESKVRFYLLFCTGVKKSVTQREGHRLRVSENRVLRNIFGPRREKVAGGLRSIMRSFITCTLKQILIG
jgi:hypothetical protein